MTIRLADWNQIERGGGTLKMRDGTLRFSNTDAIHSQYCDAQIDDYRHLSRRNFAWQSPVTLRVTARFSHTAGDLRGTAGFGFWNDPFLMTGWRMPAPPRAVWFFYASPPSNMKLDQNTPGYGWKAATLDTLRPAFFALLPTLPIAIPLMNIPAVYRKLWRIGQRAATIREKIIAVPMTNWHRYLIHWENDSVSFAVDDEIVLKTDVAPRGRLGFVMWLDNQFLQITPWGRFKWGLLDAPAAQWMDVRQLSIQF